MFGTSKNISFIVEAPKKPAWYIILPESRPRLIWNFIVLLILLYTAIVVPYRCAFVESNEDSDFMQNWEIFIDSMYIFDFLLTFLLAFEDHDKKIEIRLRLIAINYIKTWFLLDFIACIPFQYIMPDYN